MNKVIPAHSRVVRELVILEDPTVPLILNDKGTVKEKLTIERYAAKIDRAYECAFTSKCGEVPLPDVISRESLVRFLEMTLKVYLPDIVVKESDDLFEHGQLLPSSSRSRMLIPYSGLNSLLSIRLHVAVCGMVNKANPDKTADIPKNVIYENPSIGALSNFILTILGSGETDASSSGLDTSERMKAIEDRCCKNIQSIPRYSNGVVAHCESRKVVVLTGSTGGLGTFLLDQLLRHESVELVYCLNRSSKKKTLDRQLASYEDKGLDMDLLLDAVGVRLVFFDVDLSNPNLGLSESCYDKV